MSLATSPFKQLLLSLDTNPQRRVVLQGNVALALGVVHAGYGAADGYPGTPSTEVIDKCLGAVQDQMKVGWSVSEAAAVAVGQGYAMAGLDTIITMKTPGLFQAGDVISTSAFYPKNPGAIVWYVATDYAPSSTQHLVDVCYFLRSCQIPVLTPQNHQEMYYAPFWAADLSRQAQTPVAVVASGILAHSEGIVLADRKRQAITPAELMASDMHSWMLMPRIARQNYNHAVVERNQQVLHWVGQNQTELFTQSQSPNPTDPPQTVNIISTGESSMIVAEVLTNLKTTPPVTFRQLGLSLINPLPLEQIKSFLNERPAPTILVEDGSRFVEEQLLAEGIAVLGKGGQATITDWTPELLTAFLLDKLQLQNSFNTNREAVAATKSLTPPPRPPSICPGCPYRATAITIKKLKKQKKIFTVFGDIGCSTLLYFLDAIDTVLCMGASDSVRQGFVNARPEMASKVLSILGDSCECHSGLDSTRNAIFKQIPGVKIIFDNATTAMTGGQPAPSSPLNLQGQANRFNLEKAVAGENARTVVVNAFSLAEVERELNQALNLAEKGIYSVLIIRGTCVQDEDARAKVPVKHYPSIQFDKCKRCKICLACPAIQWHEDTTSPKGRPEISNLCSQCDGQSLVCVQICPHQAIEASTTRPTPSRQTTVDTHSTAVGSPDQTVRSSAQWPNSFKVAIRGIGGQGNIFMGKMLAEVALAAKNYIPSHAAALLNIVKGETHGMAQMGGPVISTFAWGDVHSPIFMPQTADVLMALEYSEIWRDDFLQVLKPDGIILLNHFKVVPAGVKMESYPAWEDTLQRLHERGHTVYTLEANTLAITAGDQSGRSANIIMLGLLSTIAPFDLIPWEAWTQAITSLSKEERQKERNLKAFHLGRTHKFS